VNHMAGCLAGRLSGYLAEYSRERHVNLCTEL
jgi:hypothetical protein